MQYRIIILIVALAFGGGWVAGCASGSSAQRSAEEADVQADPPSADEDTAGELPPGPDVELSPAKVDAPAEQAGEQAQQAPSITRAELDAFIAKGPPFALTQVQVEPWRVDGEFRGYEIVAIRPAARDQLAPHLEKGDVVTHINGVRMEKPDDYLNAWKLLSEVSTIRIDYIRDGESARALWRVE